MTHSLRFFAFVSFCVAFFTVFQPAQAFVRTKATTPDGKEVSLFWNEFPIKYHINKAGSPDITDLEGTYDAIKASFQAWMNPGCGCFQANFVGFTDLAETGYNQDKPDEDQNVIFFRKDDWGHNRQAVAVTSVVYSRSTGQIFGFDIEINDRDYRFSLDGSSVPGIPRPIATIDLQNTITHEAGHALGLDHSDNKSATMYASAPPGETSKRQLHSDDIEGLCTIYRKETASQICQIARSEQFLNGTGCACQTSSPTQSPILPLFALLLLLFLRRRF
jgi:MYXO-CTERM domain-containing protein